MTTKVGIFSRLVNLWRGIWGVKLSDAEVRNAEAVYHSAIRQRTSQFSSLKDAVARLVYLRNRLDADIQQRQKDLELVELGLARSVNDDESKALCLIRTKRGILGELERLEGEHLRITAQAETAKEGLREVSDSIRRLKQERTEMLARKAHALARLEVSEILERSTSDLSSTNQSLDTVREAITRLECRAELDATGDLDLTGDLSLAELRRSFEDEEDLIELAALRARLALPKNATGQSRRPETQNETVGGVV